LQPLRSLLAAPLRHPALARTEPARRDVSSASLERGDPQPWVGARTLAAEPRLLRLDEAAAGLNHAEACERDALIKRLAHDGTTVILVEHQLRPLMGIPAHIPVLGRGGKPAQGTPGQRARSCVPGRGPRGPVIEGLTPPLPVPSLSPIRERTPP
jgi:energy-coupling factor transporter ATP-binding protein EcfA2